MSNNDEIFIVQRNIERFNRLLATEENQKKRAILTQLLVEERAKQYKKAP